MSDSAVEATVRDGQGRPQRITLASLPLVWWRLIDEQARKIIDGSGYGYIQIEFVNHRPKQIDHLERSRPKALE